MKERTDEHMAKNLSRMTREAEQRELRLRDDMEKLRIQQEQSLGILDTKIDAMMERRTQAIMDRLDGLLSSKSGPKEGEPNSGGPSREPRVNFNEHHKRKTYGSTRGRGSSSGYATRGNGTWGPNSRTSSTGNRQTSNERPTQGTHATGRSDSGNRGHASPRRSHVGQAGNTHGDSDCRDSPHTEPQTGCEDTQAGHSRDATAMATAFEPLNRSLETFLTRLSRTNERSEKSRRVFKKPRCYKDESDGCIDTWIEVMKLHFEQEWNGRTVLRPIAYGSKVLSDTEMKYGAPKAEMFAVVTFVEKYRAYLGSAPFKLRVDNRALSWLKTYSMDQSYIGRWIVRLDGYHMIIEHRMRDKHQNADSLSKKTEFYERLEQKQANQAEIKEGFSFLDKETYEALPLTRWLDKSGHPIPGHPELTVEKAAEIKILSNEDPVPLDLLLRSNLVQQELSRMNINSLSLLDRTVQVTPQVMRMLSGLLEREVTRDDPEWTAAVASLTVSEKVKIMPSRRQHEENERDCRTIVQQLVSSIPHEILTSTSYGQKKQGGGHRAKENRHLCGPG